MSNWMNISSDRSAVRKKEEWIREKNCFPISVNLSRTSALHEDERRRYIDIIVEKRHSFFMCAVALTERPPFIMIVEAMTEHLTDADVSFISTISVGVFFIDQPEPVPVQYAGRLIRVLLMSVARVRENHQVEQVITLSKPDMKVGG